MVLDTNLKVAWISLAYSLPRRKIREVGRATGLTGDVPSSRLGLILEAEAKPELAYNCCSSLLSGCYFKEGHLNSPQLYLVRD